MKNLKQELLNGEFIEFTNDNEDLISIWFQKRSNQFCLELNSELIKCTKTLKPIINKVEVLLGNTSCTGF
tara:strand:+ start:223 stop:432 length:210 start_codon:yes stop_codon:yes gene_type:complete